MLSVLILVLPCQVHPNVSTQFVIHGSIVLVSLALVPASCIVMC